MRGGIVVILCILVVVRGCLRCVVLPPRLVPSLASPSSLPMLSVAPSSNGHFLDSLMIKRGNRFAAQAEGEEEEEVTEEEEGEEGKLKASMINAIKWYRKTLSPLMPPNCRFLPTCSNYGIEAIQTYGSWKGGLLTAWRILRCNPFGGAGYDPPTWPPVGFWGGSRYQRKK